MINGNDMNGLPSGRRIWRVLLALSASAFVLILISALFLTRPFVEIFWDDVPPVPESAYRQGEVHLQASHGTPVISPFHLQTDPMTGLLLINFESDPDLIYMGFEPQIFDDSVHGRGILVIGWRVDGKVDVFHEAGLRLDPKTYGIAGKGLHILTERDFSESLFELGPTGAQVDIAFQDLQGRPVRLEIRETDTRPRTRFGLLAPMGSAASDPPALPLVYVDEFYFVRRAGTEYRIEIDGRNHRNDSIPLMLDGTLVHFLRYSADPFIVMWNHDEDARVRVLDLDPDPIAGAFVADVDGVRYDLEANGAFREIRRMSRRQGEHEVIVEFNPAFPQILALNDDVEVNGEFRITAQPGVGTVKGRWRVVRQDGELQLLVVPNGGWTPGPAPSMARLLFRVVPTFRAWPTTYQWRGVIQLPSSDTVAGEPLVLWSGWERIPQ